MRERELKRSDKVAAYLENEETDEEIVVPYTYIAEAFEKYGGSFVRSLWTALRHADPFNVAKILSTRPSYVQQYCNQFIIPKLQQNEEEQNQPGETDKEADEN